MLKAISLLIFSSLFLVSCGGAPADLSGIKAGGEEAFVVIKAEIVGRQCSKKSLEIGRRTKEGTYTRVARIPIGTKWSQTGAQLSLKPGEYHIVGLTCFSSFNAAFIPGRREPGMIPFNPTYYDSLGHFSVTQGDVVALGNMRLTMQDDGRFGIGITAFSDKELQDIRLASSSIGSRLISRLLIPSTEPVQGRCVLGTVKVGCDRLKDLHEKLVAGAKAQ